MSSGKVIKLEPSTCSSPEHDRAPPRRRPRGTDHDDQPVFLRKAFTMISTCPSELGGWSEDGQSVIIKDVKLFSEKIIPEHYRHNNFSSFVRQLNFYGFRKVKSECLKESQWWIFRHPQFIRGHAELLCEIKRSVHFGAENSNDKEVADLKDQVLTLTDKIAELTMQVEKLGDVVSNIQGHGMIAANETENKKKRKVLTIENKSEMEVAQSIFNNEEETASVDLDWFEDESFGNGILDSLQSLTPPETPAVTPSMNTPEFDAHAVVAVRELSSILCTLTPELKERFVDKLAEVMGVQLANSFRPTLEVHMEESIPSIPVAEPLDRWIGQSSQQQSYSMYGSASASASAAATAPQTFTLPSGGKAPEIALPLASAALGAWIISSLHKMQHLSNPVDLSMIDKMSIKV